VAAAAVFNALIGQLLRSVSLLLLAARLGLNEVLSTLTGLRSRAVATAAAAAGMSTAG
jgi:hypothetical protein